MYIENVSTNLHVQVIVCCFVFHLIIKLIVFILFIQGKVGHQI